MAEKRKTHPDEEEAKAAFIRLNSSQREEVSRLAETYADNPKPGAEMVMWGYAEYSEENEEEQFEFQGLVSMEEYRKAENGGCFELCVAGGVCIPMSPENLYIHTVYNTSKKGENDVFLLYRDSGLLPTQMMSHRIIASFIVAGSAAESCSAPPSKKLCGPETEDN